MKKLLAMFLMLLPFIGSAQHLVQFKWQENGITSNGYSPAVTVKIGETHQIQFTSTPYTPDIFSEEYYYDWVYYELVNNTWIVVDTPSVFSITENGVITGLKSGFAAIKPTGHVQGNNERLYIEVTEPKEKEPNDTWESATELQSVPLQFSLSSQSDVDWFKVSATQNDEILFKISINNATIRQDYIFKVETYDSEMTMWNRFNKVLSPETNFFEVPLKAHFYTGEYYVKIYFDSTPIFFYGDTLFIQAFINGEPVSGVTEIVIDNECLSRNGVIYFDLYGRKIDLDSSKGQILIKTDGKTTSKFINR